MIDADYNRLTVEIVDFSERRIKRRARDGGYNSDDRLMHRLGHIHSLGLVDYGYSKDGMGLPSPTGGNGRPEAWSGQMAQ